MINSQTKFKTVSGSSGWIPCVAFGHAELWMAISDNENENDSECVNINQFSKIETQYANDSWMMDHVNKFIHIQK